MSEAHVDVAVDPDNAEPPLAELTTCTLHFNADIGEEIWGACQHRHTSWHRLKCSMLHKQAITAC